MKKIITMLFLLFISFSINNTVFAQVTLIGTGGGSFATIAAAYAAMTSGAYTIQLESTYAGETTPITLGVTTATSVTIRPAAGANGLTLTASAVNNYAFLLNGCQNVTIDGRPGGVISTPANYLNITNNFTGAANNAAGTVQFNGADNCTYQYINATSALGTASFTGARVINIAGISGNTSNNNIVQNCIVRGGLRGIQDFGLDAANINQSNIIRNNDIANYFNTGLISSNNNLDLIKQNKIWFTSTMTTVATFLGGAQVASNNTTFEENEIVGLTSLNCTSYLFCSDFGSGNTFRKNKFHDPVLPAGATQVNGMQFSSTGNNTVFTENEIYNFSITGASSFVIGMSFANNAATVGTFNITKNKIYNLSSTNTSNIRAMSCFPRSGSTLNINNNFISITQANNKVAAIFGILLGASQGVVDTTAINGNVYYNTINIGGQAKDQPLGSINATGIYKSNANTSSVFNVRNNISSNTRTNDTSHSIMMGSYYANTNGTLNIDYNTYYASDLNGGFAAGWITTLYNNLANYRTAAYPNENDADFNSVTFVSSTDLHLSGASTTDPYLACIPAGGITTDIDNATRNTVKPTRGADEVSAQFLSLDLKMNFEACPLSDYVLVILTDATSPYAVVDFAVGFGGGSIPNIVHFANAVNGVPYYVVVTNAVNSIETWSSSPVTFVNQAASYDFTSSISQAYGNNQTLSASIPSIYQGDVNQDGFIDLTDISYTFNEAAAFLTSDSTDFNCDGLTDLTDLVLVFNNASAFVVAKFPTGPSPEAITRRLPVMRTTNNVSSTSNNNLTLPVNAINKVQVSDAALRNINQDR